MSDHVTPDTVTHRVAEVIREHQLMGMPPPQDLTCRCGWTSDFPASEWYQHVAEQIESDQMLRLLRRAVAGAVDAINHERADQ